MRGVLLSFQPLRLGWSGSAELGNLISAEWARRRCCRSRGAALMCGFYLNELLLRLLPRDDPHEALFDAYGEALARLAAPATPSAVLRGFEKRLLAELGYAPLLDRDAASRADRPRRASTPTSPSAARCGERHPRRPAGGAAAGRCSTWRPTTTASPKTRDEASAT